MIAIYQKKLLIVLTVLLLSLFSRFAFADCSGGPFTDAAGSISITGITPEMGSALESGERYTFDVQVKYKFNKKCPGTYAGQILITAVSLDTQGNYNNLDNQVQEGPYYVNNITGSKTVRVTTDLSLSGNPVKGVLISVALCGVNCSNSYVGDTAFYVTTEGPWLSQFPLEGSPDFYRISNNFYDVYKQKRHLGVDILSKTSTPLLDQPVHAVCFGIVVENNTSKPETYDGYWNSVLIIQHGCGRMFVYGYYGHIKSNLKNGDFVDERDVIGTIRASYNQSNQRTPGSDHLHFGLSTYSGPNGSPSLDEYPPIKPWGYAPLSKSCESLLVAGWLNPEVFFTWGGQTNPCP